jgi:hypothetical protein
LLEQAIAEVKKLPPEAQDEIASRLLAEIAADAAWDASFAATTDEQWDKMAEKVRANIAAGNVLPMEEILPPEIS